MLKIGFIGYGNMGQALVKGLLNAQIPAENIFVTRSELSKFKASEKFHVVATAQNVIERSDIIFLAVKPHLYEQILTENNLLDKTFISIGAGISSEFMSRYTSNFVLTMPNTSASNNSSLTSIVKSDIDNYKEVSNLFENLGQVFEIKEEELETYIALLGSSPAYFYYYIEKLAESFKVENSEKLLATIMLNSAQNILSTNTSAKDLKQSVCSEGGCTVEYVKHLDDEDVDITINEAVEHVIAKAAQMKQS